MVIPEELLIILQFLYTWGWMIAPIILFFVWKHVWILWIQRQYAHGVEWVTLELKVPHSVERTPKVMEQVFAGLHSMKSSGNLIDTYWKGKHQLHISMEVVGIAGAIHFFIRAPQQFQKLIQSQIYAQYKDAEIDEVEDYTRTLPANLPNEGYDIWGTELEFTKDDAYPIRTYKHFEEPSTEKKYIDPLASLVEVLGELEAGEQVWIQYLIKPVGDEWQKKGQQIIDRLIGRKNAKGSSNILEEIFEFFYDLVAIPFGKDPKTYGNEEKQDKTPETLMQHLSPGAKDTVAALEESISKHGFETAIRILYVAKSEIFTMNDVTATMGAFQQFSTFNLNGFKPNSKVTPNIDYFFIKTRERMRKRRIYAWARNRFFKDVFLIRKRMILNTEELATVYHVPSIVLEVPMLSKIMAKKAEPPTSLPTI